MPDVVRRRAAVATEMVDAIELKSISLGGECGFQSLRPHIDRTLTSLTDVEKAGYARAAPRPEGSSAEGGGRLGGSDEAEQTSAARATDRERV